MDPRNSLECSFWVRAVINPLQLSLPRCSKLVRFLSPASLKNTQYHGPSAYPHLPMISAGLSLFSIASLLRTGSAFVPPPVQQAEGLLKTTRLASSTTTSSPVGKMTDTGDGDVLEPQGTHHPWYSIQPLIEAGKWSTTPGEYL